MKVLHLPVILCNVISETVRALDQIGVKADYMVIDSQDSEWLLTENNIKYNLQATKLANSSRDARKMRLAFQSFFLKAIDEYDVFHFHSGITFFSSWFGNTDDLEILKKAGKKIVVTFWGCDARIKKINSKYQYNTCDVCKIGCNDLKKHELIEKFKKYADLITIPSGEYRSILKGAKLWEPIVNTDFWKPKPKLKREETIYIFHPFGNSALRGDVKGSIQIGQAIERLQKEGFKIELLGADKVKNADLKPIYNQADIVIEQLRAGWMGATAREALSMGKPVITYLRSDCLRHSQKLPPVISANPDTIYNQLKRLVVDEKLRRKLGKESRDYALKEFNPVTQAEKLERWYRGIIKTSKKIVLSKEEIKNETRKAIGFNVLVLDSNNFNVENVRKIEAGLKSAGFRVKKKKYQGLVKTFYQAFLARPDVIIYTDLSTSITATILKYLKGCSIISVGKSEGETKELIQKCSKLTSTKDILWQEKPESAF